MLLRAEPLRGEVWWAELLSLKAYEAEPLGKAARAVASLGHLPLLARLLEPPASVNVSLHASKIINSGQH